MSDNVITIGADPEFFVSVEGKLVSAHGLVAGTKEEPHIVEGGAVQVDGMALEFNIDPAKTAKEFVGNVNTVLGEMRKLVPDNYSFEMIPVAEFGLEYIQAQPEEAKMLGCEPDFNGYSGDVNTPPDVNASFRTAAGHVHIGVEGGLDELEQRKLVILCDILLGLPSLAYDTDTKRRSLYGMAGCYRPKPYGIEYRTLSNAWLATDKLTELTFKRAKRAVELLPRFGEVIESLEDKMGKDYNDLQDIINDSCNYVAKYIHNALSKEFDYV